MASFPSEIIGLYHLAFNRARYVAYQKEALNRRRQLLYKIAMGIVPPRGGYTTVTNLSRRLTRECNTIAGSLRQ